MKNKMLSLLIGISCIAYTANANEGFQKGFYAGVSLGGSSFKGKRSDWHVSNDGTMFQFSKGASISNTSERGEAFLGYFLPFYQDKLGISFEGFYAFSSLNHRIRHDLEIQPGIGFYLTERLQTKRSFGGSFRLGPIIHKKHFIGTILGFESARFTRSHEDGVGKEFHKVSKQKAGFQYGLTYQYAWNNSSSIGIDLKQTRFSSMTLSKADSTSAITTTRFKPKINSLVVRYTYRFY
ncbi:hypothetical protein IM40_03665 [Candidatus Paracaedimonas acanthamoebae]|nr:hypothetical protein IM40_03665 [Candidatus Paracaedimonas acanthamoebae]